MIRFYLCKKCGRAHKDNKDFFLITCQCGTLIILNQSVTAKAKEISEFDYMAVLAKKAKERNRTAAINSSGVFF